MSKVERSHIGTYEKTRRYEVPKGTRYTSVVVDFNWRLEPRFIAESHALHEAKRLFKEAYPNVKADDTEFVVTHCTSQIIVEMREVL